MNLPAQTQDVWTPATDSDKLKALASLGGLPSRVTTSAERDEATFFVALDGVTRYGLFEAVRKIMQNALGHGFFPSPPELRGLCDKAMEHHVAMRDRIERRQRALHERPGERPPLTEAERERQRERMAKFHAAFGESDKDAELAAIRAKYDPELLAQMPDAPLPKGWTQVGVAA